MTSPMLTKLYSPTDPLKKRIGRNELM